MTAAAITSMMAFNLVCSGTTTTEYVARSSSEPYSAIYRVDLDRSEFCEGVCEAPRKIYRVEPTELLLELSDNPDGMVRSSFLNQVDRRTGEQRIDQTNQESDDHDVMWIVRSRGHCEKAPFTGFPKFDTKF
ncbi:hypothetical protein [Sphingomonas sp. PAMC 26605]|uniref:hypothetical protein n=1 Tax=Sphingomonas sp. PAMC 26605 TaxID=1112214 RepID=UPI000563B289|nr:hypothetical protein [Sphingomonas sp. PAMC 26605]